MRAGLYQVSDDATSAIPPTVFFGESMENTPVGQDGSGGIYFGRRVMEEKCLFFLPGLKWRLEKLGSSVGDASERGLYERCGP